LHEPAKDTLPGILSWLKQCSERGAEAVLFPECALGHYFDDPIPLDGDAVAGVVDAAAMLGLHIGLGFGELARGKRYSSYLLVGPQGIAGLHRKTRWQTDRCPMELGKEVRGYLWAGVRTGVLICSESWHPDRLAADLATERVELLIVPAAVGPLRGESGRSLYERMLVANARLLGAPAISVGAVGPDLLGSCMVVDRRGVVRHWQTDDHSKMHRFDLELPEGKVVERDSPHRGGG
jgi:predicted amidohydrolase